MSQWDELISYELAYVLREYRLLVDFYFMHHNMSPMPDTTIRKRSTHHLLGRNWFVL